MACSAKNFERWVICSNVALMVLKLVAFSVTGINSVLSLAVDSACDLAFSFFILMFHSFQKVIYIKIAVWSCQLAQIVPILTLLRSIVAGGDYDLPFIKFLIIISILSLQIAVKGCLYFIGRDHTNAGTSEVVSDQIYDLITGVPTIVAVVVIFLTTKPVPMITDYVVTIALFAITIIYWDNVINKIKSGTASITRSISRQNDGIDSRHDQCSDTSIRLERLRNKIIDSDSVCSDVSSPKQPVAQNTLNDSIINLENIQENPNVREYSCDRPAAFTI